MKKTCVSLLALTLSSWAMLSSAAPSSRLKLPGGGNLEPATSLNLSLAPLMKGVYYNLTCQVNNPQAEAVDLRFQPSARPAENTIYGKIFLNESELENQQGSAQSGDNTLIIKDLSVADDKQVLEFKNLDLSHRVEVSACLAEPAIRAKPLFSSGYFIAYNETPHFVEIRVGNFFPTPYTLPPFGNRFVSVSTDNQNLRISHIY